MTPTMCRVFRIENLEPEQTTRGIDRLHGCLSNWRVVFVVCCRSLASGSSAELRPRGFERQPLAPRSKTLLPLAAAATTAGSSAQGTIMRWLRAFLRPVRVEPYEARCKVTANPSKLRAISEQLPFSR